MPSKIPRPCPATPPPKNIRPTTMPRTSKASPRTNLPNVQAPSPALRSFQQQEKGKSALESPRKSVSSIPRQTSSRTSKLSISSTTSTGTKTISGSEASIGSFANETVVDDDIKEINSALIGLIMPSSDHDLLKLPTNLPANLNHEKNLQDTQNAWKQDCNKNTGSHQHKSVTPPRRENTFNYDEKPVLELTPLTLAPEPAQLFNICNLMKGEDGELSAQGQNEPPAGENRSQGFVDELFQEAALTMSSICPETGSVQELIPEIASVSQFVIPDLYAGLGERDYQATEQPEKISLKQNDRDLDEAILVATMKPSSVPIANSDWMDQIEHEIQGIEFAQIENLRGLEEEGLKNEGQTFGEIQVREVVNDEPLLEKFVLIEPIDRNQEFIPEVASAGQLQICTELNLASEQNEDRTTALPEAIAVKQRNDLKEVLHSTDTPLTATPPNPDGMNRNECEQLDESPYEMEEMKGGELLQQGQGQTMEILPQKFVDDLLQDAALIASTSSHSSENESDQNLNAIQENASLSLSRLCSSVDLGHLEPGDEAAAADEFKAIFVSETENLDEEIHVEILDIPLPVDISKTDWIEDDLVEQEQEDLGTVELEKDAFIQNEGIEEDIFELTPPSPLVSISNRDCNPDENEQQNFLVELEPAEDESFLRLSEIQDALQEIRTQDTVKSKERFPSIVYFEKAEGDLTHVHSMDGELEASVPFGEMEEEELLKVIDPFTDSLAEESISTLSFNAPSMIRFSTLTVLPEEVEVSSTTSQDEDESCDLDNVSECPEITSRCDGKPHSVEKISSQHVVEVVDNKDVEEERLFDNSTLEMEPEENNIPNAKEINLGENENITPSSQKQVEFISTPKSILHDTNSTVSIIHPKIAEENVISTDSGQDWHKKFSQPIKTSLAVDMIDASSVTEDEFFQSDVETQTQVYTEGNDVQLPRPNKKATDLYRYSREKLTFPSKKNHEEKMELGQSDDISSIAIADVDEEGENSRVALVAVKGTETDYSTDVNGNFTDAATVTDGDGDELLFTVNLKENHVGAKVNVKSEKESSYLPKTKKTKTIFRVDRPLSPTQVSAEGSGQYGDGCSVLPAKPASLPIIPEESQSRDKNKRSMKMTDSEKTFKRRMSKGLCHRKSTATAFDDTDTTGFQHRVWTSMEYDVPLLTFKNGTVEIQSKVNLLATSTSKYSFPTSSKELDSSQRRQETLSNSGIRQCRAVVPTRSTLILKRSLESSNVFCKSLQIHNSTSCDYAFKVTCNPKSAHFISIIPHLGVIPPHSEISVNVATARCHEFNFKEWMKATRSNSILVKICRFHSKDIAKLNDTFFIMERDHPDLVITQTIEKIILWDSEDLTGMHQMLSSIKDERERSFLKNEIHKSRFSGGSTEETGLVLYLQDIIQSIQGQVAALRENVTEIYEELEYFRNSQNAIYVVLLMFIAIYVIAQTPSVGEKR